MTETASSPMERVRTAEVVAAASLATDLGMGFPFEHGLHATLMAMRLCDLLEVDTDTASHTYYTAILMYMGCTTDAQKNAEVFAGSRTEHLAPSTWGSFGERLGGIIRALPPDDADRLLWTVEVARRLPRMVVAARGHFTGCARWRRCSPGDSGSPLRCMGCSRSSPSVGTARAFFGERRESSGWTARTT